MDLKAFNKLYSEAEEALAERRLNDAFQLTASILEDTPDTDTASLLQDAIARYVALLRENVSDQHVDHLNERLEALFRDAILLLQRTRVAWSVAHKTPFFGSIASQMQEFDDLELARQIQYTTLSHVGEKAYHEALDAAFGFLWCAPVREAVQPAVVEQLSQADSFARRTLVGALLLGLEEAFEVTKLELLLELGRLAEETLRNVSLMDENDEQRSQMEADANDFYARVAVVLVLVFQRYQSFLSHFPQLSQRMHSFFASDRMRPCLPSLLKAFVAQSLTDRVGKQVDDIQPIIKEALERSQPHLAGNDDEKKKKDGQQMEVRVAKLDLKAGRKLFRQMADYAERIDEMRQNDMDVNASNFVHMKRFAFFDHPAHWFYPFDTRIPDIQKGIHTCDGKPDRMTLSIMVHNRFCDSDCYSYASMMAFLRSENQTSIADILQQHMEEMDEESEDFLDAIQEDDESIHLNPFSSVCQTAYRCLHRPEAPDCYAHAFAPTDDILLPLLPLFDGLFDDYSQIDPAVEIFMSMGDCEHAVILLNYGMEHFGTTALALAQRGYALMQQKLWRRAISDFQQSLILEEDNEVQLYMARCYEALSDWSFALPLLQEEDKRQDGKDADIVEEMARCLLQLERWDEAAGLFFRLEFMGQHLGVAQRGIGWCSLHQGKYERAEQYYRKLIDAATKPSWEDCLNLGHALWLQGRNADARDAYRRFVTIFNRSRKVRRAHFRHWSEAFREDAQTVLAKRYGAADVALMIDAISLKDA